MQLSLKSSSKFSNWEKEFGLFADDKGIWRSGERLQHADLSYGQTHPIILDQSHRYSELVVEECHIVVGHNEVKETLTELRSKYWIVRGRQCIRRILKQCRVCRRLESLP